MDLLGMDMIYEILKYADYITIYKFHNLSKSLSKDKKIQILLKKKQVEIETEAISILLNMLYRLLDVGKVQVLSEDNTIIHEFSKSWLWGDNFYYKNGTIDTIIYIDKLRELLLEFIDNNYNFQILKVNLGSISVKIPYIEQIPGIQLTKLPYFRPVSDTEYIAAYKYCYDIRINTQEFIKHYINDEDKEYRRFLYEYRK